MGDASESNRAGQLLGLGLPASYRPVAVRHQLLSTAESLTWERLEFDTDDGDTIPALFLTPAVPGKWLSAAIAVHQHADDFALGKSEVAGLRGDSSLATGCASHKAVFLS